MQEETFCSSFRGLWYVPWIRYKFPKAADAYGKKVWTHLATIQHKLEAEPPARQTWCKLLKEICDYVGRSETSKKSTE